MSFVHYTTAAEVVTSLQQVMGASRELQELVQDLPGPADLEAAP